MRGLIVAAVVILALVAAFAFGLIDINQTRETKMPEIAVENGQMPAFDVDTARIDVETKPADIDVPTVDVGTRKEQVDLPTVDVEKAR